MKTVGITLVWVGIIALLRNMGFIQIVDWNIVWPVIIIIAGFSIKNCRGWKMHHMMGGKSNVCADGTCCGKCEGGKCEGGNCGDCKK